MVVPDLVVQGRRFCHVTRPVCRSLLSFSSMTADEKTSFRRNKKDYVHRKQGSMVFLLAYLM